MSLPLLRTAIYEVSSKSEHTFSDVIALQLIGIQLMILFSSSTSEISPKVADSFNQYLYKETLRVLRSAKSKPDSEKEI